MRLSMRRAALGGAGLLASTAMAALGVPFPASSPDAPPVAESPAATPTISPWAAPTPEPTPTSTPAPSAPKPRPPRAATLVMGGDLLWHDTVWRSAAEDGARTGRRFNFDPMFAALRPLVEGADVALCHEEVPFAAAGAAYQGYPVFAAPPQIAPWIADMGYDACVTASNHTLDQGYDGLVRTADLLEANGVRHIGTFRTERERHRPVIVETDEGVRIGVVAGTYGLNGFPLPEGKEWSVSLWGARNLLAQARAARRVGADIVVVHLHGGNEYDHLPNADQVALVERLTRSPDVDLVLGEHAHVVQPITKVNGTWVAYGMGNLVAQQEVERPRTYEGITVRFTFTERPRGGFWVSEAAYVPTYWSRYSPGRPIRIQRVVRALARGSGNPVLAQRLRQARAEIRGAVHGLGRTPGLHEL